MIRIGKYLLVAVLLCFAQLACAEVDIQKPELFKEYNPDGQKYAFVRDYITSLSYLKKNTEINEAMNADISQDLIGENKIDQVEAMRHNMVQNNVNLRVARNYLDRYSTNQENGLILLATDQFKKACNALIELNTQERVQLEYYYEALYSKDEDNFDLEAFDAARQAIHTQRKEASKLLLETSVLVSKILMSNEENYFGEFDMLGVTQEERHRLIFKLDEFEGESFEGEPRVGQTFLEASISVIREILEDYRYSSLRG